MSGSHNFAFTALRSFFPSPLRLALLCKLYAVILRHRILVKEEAVERISSMREHFERLASRVELKLEIQRPQTDDNVQGRE